MASHRDTEDAAARVEMLASVPIGEGGDHRPLQNYFRVAGLMRCSCLMRWPAGAVRKPAQFAHIFLDLKSNNRCHDDKIVEIIQSGFGTYFKYISFPYPECPPVGTGSCDYVYKPKLGREGKMSHIEVISGIWGSLVR